MIGPPKSGAKMTDELPASWPQSLRTAFAICSELPFPACLVCGSDRSTFPNERFKALSPAVAFAAIQPALDRALAGEASCIEIQPALTLALTPVRDESAAI